MPRFLDRAFVARTIHIYSSVKEVLGWYLEKNRGGFYIKGVGSCLAGFGKCAVIRVSLSVIGAWAGGKSISGGPGEVGSSRVRGGNSRPPPGEAL